MQLKVINSNSAGNAYILETEKEALLIEAGVNFKKIKEAMNFRIGKIVGCLITHEDGDHSKFNYDVRKAGINVYSSPGTMKALGIDNVHYSKLIIPYPECKTPTRIGNFEVIAFDTKHDVEQPVGFYIFHPEAGNILFLTDTYYCEYTFPDLNHVLIEANYCTTILNSRLKQRTIEKFLADRIKRSHFSLQNCIEMLKKNDLSQVHNIVLIHLSDGNSDAKRFKKEVQEATGRITHIAEPGLSLSLNQRQPF